MTILSEKKVTSVPVYDTKEDRYNSFVSYLDICFFITRLYNNPKISDKFDNWKSTTCGEVANLSKTCAYQSVRNTDNLRSAMLKMVSLSNIRRMPVVDLQDNLVGILSQSQIINILSSKIQTFPIANFAIEDLNLGTLRKIRSIQLTATVKEAFSVLVEHKFYGIPVVDEQNHPVGNISALDIQLVVASDFAALEKPVKDILPETHQKRTPICIRSDQTLTEAFQIMSKEKIHRLFVVDSKNRLAGLISPVDLIQVLLDNIA
uniref:CBS domain-containing protein n=1 Tax=Arcella intermedia TaxID=1963864 RepID=A0A6B2LCA2_9EUKA